MTSFITLTKEQFENNLPKDFENITNTTNAKEHVYQCSSKKENVGIRIYSSIDINTNETREKGTDAIRIVLWDLLNNRPLKKSKRIHRTEGKTTIAERIEKRINEFMICAESTEIIDFKYTEFVLSNFRTKDFALSLYNQVRDRGSLSDKQMSYVLGNNHPSGYDTFEQQLQKRMTQDQINDSYINYIDSKDDDAPFPTNDKTTSHRSFKEMHENYIEKKKIKLPVDLKDNVELISTEGYPYEFDNFNPVQSLVYPHRKTDCNMIISANTSAGKTICAEIVMDEVLKKDERIIYMSPLKSLTQEKYDDWQERFPDEEITILTGDYVLSKKMKEQLSKSRIIVLTSEMLDSRTRKYQSEKNFWMKQVGLVIVDESHILTTNRGHAVETGIMRFTDINPDSKVIFLSATMPNVTELGEWLSLLNNKHTEVIYNTWRPVILNMNYLEYKIEMGGYGRPDYWATQWNKQKLVIETVLQKPKEKYLIFVHDKATGRKLIKLLADENIEAEFHSADLELQKRLEIERSFKNKNMGLRVLISTSTTAWGVNLPARNVIVTGIHRGINEVDELDIIQMAGRAGRYGVDDAGFVNLIIPEGETHRWMNIFKNPRPVMSVLNNKHILAFHSLAEIQIKNIKCPKTLLQWYSRSLAYLQEKKREIPNSILENNIAFNLDDATNLCDELIEMDMIDNNFNTTGLGNTSAWLYYSPYDIADWYKNFDCILSNNIVNDYTLSWAISDIESNISFVTKQVEKDATRLKSDIYNSGIKSIRHNTMMNVISSYNALTNEETGNGAISAMKRSLRFDINRIVSALSMINSKHANWENKGTDLFKTLAMRFRYGVGDEIVNLCRLDGIGAVRAQKIYDKGIKTLNDVAKTESKKKLMLVLNPAVIKKIQLQAKELIKGE